MVQKENSVINTKIVILYIIIVVILTTMVTWAVLSRTQVSMGPESTSATVGLTILSDGTPAADVAGTSANLGLKVLPGEANN